MAVLSNRLMNLGISKQQHLYLFKNKKFNLERELN